MTMEWNSHRAIFPKHNDYMRAFRRAHAGVAMGNNMRQNEPGLLERTRPLPANRVIMAETGGARFLSDITDRSALIPVLKVAKYKLTSN